MVWSIKEKKEKRVQFKLDDYVADKFTTIKNTLKENKTIVSITILASLYYILKQQY